MMNWTQLLSTKRFGQKAYLKDSPELRGEFQRDYDRIVFSAPFRRLQNKTQVFPLPGSVFVHNRLTHSLEVSCVGRSLGNNVGQILAPQNPDAPFLRDIGSIVSAACLVHDLGNPPFGHSGESAITTFFSEGPGKRFEQELSPEQWADVTCFEGNANALRLLTHQFEGKREGGFVLTYSTLASVVKYPYAAIYANPKKKKFGYFDSEAQLYAHIAQELGIIKNPNNPSQYARHPLVYLVEAADDICYQIMDMEDAHKLRILDSEQTIGLLLGFFEPERRERKANTLHVIGDINEQIAYLRSTVIGELIDACTKCFVENEQAILSGTFEGTLIKNMKPLLRDAYETCSKVAVDKIYRSTIVLDVELSGYKIMYTLLEELTQAVLSPQKAFSKQLLGRIPQQYDVYSPDTYTKLQAVLDYVSGMTDVYALDLYRKITGASLPLV